ncbi:MAG: hypothetical protein CMK89_11425 [Pseudomonadales bacterium]|nr:hypothetical protein [Pseudomonadales bacterium]
MPLSDVKTAITSVVRRLFTKPPMAAAVDLHNKTVIVTGTSPGSIGYETAKTLAAWGAHVVITTRSKTEACVQQLKSELQRDGFPHAIDGHSLDLTHAESVESFVEWFNHTINEPLHILINNAGVHSDILGSWTEPHLSDDGFEIHWRTNYMGAMHLTHRLLNRLEQAGTKMEPARVVFVASHLHQKGLNSEIFHPSRPYSSWLIYGQSKLGLVHAAFELQRRYGSRNIQSYVLHPGSIATNIAIKGLETNKRVQKLLQIVNPLQMLFMLSPLQGAQTQIYCATQPGLRGGRYFDRCAAAPASPEADNVLVAKRLWDETEQWIESLSEQQQSEIEKTMASTA